ncbi:TerB family tellurite resistance protein [Frigidibacter sp.]|uniref:tellurite resistance TerB family protein n=1 Tax=Frigidibacter sp. TaxID=2586418 RepID=UPI002732BCDE|nr:TerB family tellurite resistance protein [Frigidibacter sp.]MDP3339715.1 TerB family tellurite resistance protein [Frigidibacter sp.]
MSIWTRISDALSALAKGEGLSAVLDRLWGGATPPERSVAFTIAVIALGAKMAKADGAVTRDEVAAFRRVFTIPESETAHAARVFNLARQDVAGFDAWAAKIARMFGPGAPALKDLMEGLFYIAVSDGGYHPAEDAFLAEVARIFGLDERCFRSLRARHVEGAERDPWDVLGLDRGATKAEARAAWREAVRDSHPDRLVARGLPAEAVKLAEARLVAINRAWEEISGKRAA